MAKSKAGKSQTGTPQSPSKPGQNAGHRPAQARPATERVAWQEFGHASGNASSNAAFERAVPEVLPEDHNLKVQVSRKGRGGKTVTVITGFQLKPETLSDLAKTLKSQCGTGGTAKETTIEIQGDHADKLLELLLKAGYKAKRSGG